MKNLNVRTSVKYCCLLYNDKSKCLYLHFFIFSWIFVTDKPEVRCSLPSPYRVKEGESAALICTLTAANPNTSISWAWIKTDSPNTALHNRPNYIIHNIQRGRSGSYNCTASNAVGTSEPITIMIDVLCMWFKSNSM